MTLDELGRNLKREFPDYADIPDADLARAFLHEHPQYSDLVDASATLPAFRPTPQIQRIIDKKSGTIFDIFRTFSARKQAEVLEYRSKSVASYYAMTLNAEAGAAGLTLDTLERMKLLTHETNEAIRLKVAEAQIRLMELQKEKAITLGNEFENAQRRMELERQLALLQKELEALNKQP